MESRADRHSSVIRSAVNHLVAAPLRLVSAVFGDRGTYKANALAQRISPGMKPRQVTATRHGVRFELDLRDNVQHSLFFAGWYDRALTSLLFGELRSGDVYVDVGAHVGVYALPIARRLDRIGGGGRAVAFEPAPDNAKELRAAAFRNKIDNLQVVEAALGEETGFAELRFDPNFPSADTGVRSFYATGALACDVPVFRFDDWDAQQPQKRMDLLKIDVEGGEVGVLRGMTNAISRLQPRLIVLELKEALLHRAGSNRAELEKVVVDLGYRASTESLVEKHGSNLLLVPAKPPT